MTTLTTLDVRGDFPIFSREFDGQPLVYLDSGATSQKPTVVIDAISSYLSEHNANVHRGVYALAQESDAAYDGAREKVAGFVGWEAESTIFTKNVTEAINLVAYAWGRANVGPGDAVLITQMEHHANIVPWQMLCRERGAKLRYLEVDERGELSLDQLDRELAKGDVKLVAFTHVSNVLGTIDLVGEMTARIRAAGAVSLVDGAQAVPHMSVDLGTLGADFYAWTGHKALGPTGIGVLHGRAEILDEMEPFLTGGDMIASVDFDGATWNELPVQVRGGHAPDRRGRGTGSGRRLPIGARDGAGPRTRARADRLSARSPARGAGPALCRAARARESGRPCFIHDRGHARSRHRGARQPRRRVHPRRAPLRATADALPGRRSDSTRKRRRLQRAKRRGRADPLSARRLEGLWLVMDDLYRDYILDHYKRPRNFGELDPHDMEGLEHNPLCGDELGVHIRVKDGKIVDLRFYGHGCAISQASASIASEELVGMDLEEVGKLDADWAIDLLGIPVSATRRKCALLGLKVVAGAVTGDNSWPVGRLVRRPAGPADTLDTIPSP